MKELRAKKLTFVTHDFDRNKTGLVQWKSTRRTVPEAWEDCLKWLCERDKRSRQEADQVMHGAAEADDPRDWDPVWSPRYAKVGVIEGLAHWLDEAEPLRNPTPEEVKELAKI